MRRTVYPWHYTAALKKRQLLCKLKSEAAAIVLSITQQHKPLTKSRRRSNQAKTTCPPLTRSETRLEQPTQQKEQIDHKSMHIHPIETKSSVLGLA